MKMDALDQLILLLRKKIYYGLYLLVVKYLNEVVVKGVLKR